MMKCIDCEIIIEAGELYKFYDGKNRCETCYDDYEERLVENRCWHDLILFDESEVQVK